MKKTIYALLSALLLVSPVAPALEPGDCTMCHSATELSEATAESILEALRNADVRGHSRFAEVTEEDVKALMESLKEE